jgi:predicted MFS family arabinose efflux permease
MGWPAALNSSDGRRPPAARGATGAQSPIILPPRGQMLAPFRVRSFRFQWPADLATSWAFEMETLILGWYVLVETRSVFLLTVFASLQYVGTLIAPMFGVMGDRIGHRNVLCAMRAIYALCAFAIMVPAFSGAITPMYVLAIVALNGLVRPSDIGMRAAVVAATMPGDRLIGAMSIQRTTQDTARVAGALTGAGVVALLGMGPAYAIVAVLYIASILLGLRAGATRSTGKVDLPKPAARASPWRELREGLAYVWRSPHLLGVMCIALVLNVTAFPQLSGLLPYVAKDVYGADQTWLGYMTAGAAAGALLGALAFASYRRAIPAGRMAITFCIVWYATLLLYAQIEHPVAGVFALVLSGCAQSLSQVPLLTLLLRDSDEAFRGRVMGIRMLVIYGNLPGLLLAGVLIPLMGYKWTGTLYCLFGIAFTVLIAVRWRAALWRRGALCNALS